MKRSINILGTAGIIALVILAIPLAHQQSEARGAAPHALYRDQVAVLMFHHISDSDTSSDTIKPALFHQQIHYLQQQGIHFISLPQFIHFMNGAPVPDNAALITFDDGYESFYTQAYPFLKKLRIPAVNFVITGTFSNEFRAYVKPMTPAEIKAMTSRTNFIEVQCHTNNLHYKIGDKSLLTGEITAGGNPETTQQYDKQVLSDTQSCIQKLTPLNGGQPIHTFAYPYGIFSKPAERLLQQSGIHFAFTIVPQMATRQSKPMEIPRIDAGSPNISPQQLYRHILRRIRPVSHPYDAVSVRRVVHDLGGTYQPLVTGSLHATQAAARATVDGQTFQVRAGAMHIGNSSLHRPIQQASGGLTMRLDDLQKLLGPVTYNRQSGKFEAGFTSIIK